MSSIGEALIVAGVLSFAVDPFLKRRLLVEASRGVFIHLLGFEHHPQVKDRLQRVIFETKLLRKSFDLRCKIEPSDGHYIFTVDYDMEVINPTNTPLKYGPRLEFDRAHKLEVASIIFTSSDGKYRVTTLNPKIEELKDDPGVECPKVQTFVIEPETRGITYRVCAQYRIKLLNAYSQFHMGIPTLQTSIKASAPDDYEISSSPADVVNGNYWQYNRIMMVGDHFTLRWRKENGEWL